MADKRLDQIYFEQIADSFLEPAVICSATGDILFSSKVFKEEYEQKFHFIPQALNSLVIEQLPLGSDLVLKHNEERLSYNIYKMMNKTESFEDTDLFILVFKES